MKELDQVFKDMNEAFKDTERALSKVDSDMDHVFKRMDKIFKDMDDVLARGGNVARKTEVGPWKEWFAWRPVKVHGKRVWLKKVYRRTINTHVDMDNWSRCEYGNVFDIIKGDK